MSNTTTDSVRIVLFDQPDPDGFLVLTESDDPDNWKLPGGKFRNSHETPDAAAARELAEETGLQVHDVGLAMAQKLLNEDGVSARYIYWGTTLRQRVKPSDEVARSGWFTTETVPTAKTAATF